VSAGQVRVGFQPNSTASVKVDGAGSILKSSIAGAIFQVGGPFGTGLGSATVTNGGTLQFNILTTSPGPSPNKITNTGGVYQFTSAGPTLNVASAGDISLTNGTLSYKGVSGADINNAQVAQIARSGNNTFRLDNSTGAATANYTFAANTSNYQKLELMNNGAWNGTTLTIGSGGALVGNGSVNAATTVSSKARFRRD
jgi:T5SS/PEP-CTERM-associated repeat protein